MTLNPTKAIDIFSIMPIEAFMDDRLTKTDLRVLGAILSFRNKNTNLCWPKREQISERCLLSLPKISTATTHLSSLGWLVKEGSGGCSRSSHYKLTVPDLITVPNSGTVPESGTVPNSGTKTVPESGTRIKQTNKQTISKYIEKDAVVKKMTTKQLLASYLIADDLADDFITHRKALKTTITKTVLNGYVRESDKAGIPLSKAITISIERGWRGFNADWAWQTQKNQHTSHSNTGPLKTLGTNYAANNGTFKAKTRNQAIADRITEDYLASCGPDFSENDRNLRHSLDESIPDGNLIVHGKARVG